MLAVLLVAPVWLMAQTVAPRFNDVVCISVRAWQDGPIMGRVHCNHNLKTYAGAKYMQTQLFGTTQGGTISTTNIVDTIGASNSSTAPAVTDTSMAGDLNGTGVGFDHTVGTITGGDCTSYTNYLSCATSVSYTFTATGSVTALQTFGLFTHTGALFAEVHDTAHDIVSGNTVQVVWTFAQIN